MVVLPGALAVVVRTNASRWTRAIIAAAAIDRIARVRMYNRAAPETDKSTRTLHTRGRRNVSPC
jgi:hypothetical protein